MMRGWILATAWIAATLAATSMFAYGDDDQPGDPNGSLLRQNPAARFALVLGRLRLDTARYRKGTQTATQLDSDQNPITESLQVSTRRGTALVYFTRSSCDQTVRIECDGAGRWQIESRHGRLANSPHAVATQSPGEPIRVVIQPGTPTRGIAEATWLHIRQSNPDVFETHFRGLIDEMIFPYRINDLARDAHTESLRNASAIETRDVIDDVTLDEWIDDLRSPRRTVRRDAERRLRSLGVSLLPRLASIDMTRLDAEQQTRLHEIRSTLTPLVEDDAARLSMLIRDDVRYWQLAAARMSVPDRELADTICRRIQGSYAGDTRIAERP